ncbi:MAG: citrate synthase [Oligoflexales bacterium]
MLKSTKTITAVEAAELLKIKRETLYAYVSRGLVRSVGSRDRESLYLRADILALLQTKLARRGEIPPSSPAIHWGTPVLESSITNIKPGGPFYRGYSALDLAEGGFSFENVAELIWSGILPGEPRIWPIEKRKEKFAHGEADPIRNFISIVANELLSLPHPRKEQTADQVVKEARYLISRLAYAIGPSLGKKSAYRSSKASPIAETILTGIGITDKHAERLINRALIVCADHELTASTFAARIAASTGAEYLACISTALGVFSGPEHGMTFIKVESMLRDIEAKKGDLDKHHRNLAEVSSHLLYQSGDPRSKPIIEYVKNHFPKNKKITRIIDFLGNYGNKEPILPTMDVALLILTRALGVPSDLAPALFALGRIAGLTAHILEQCATGAMIRPRAKYVGK